MRKYELVCIVQPELDEMVLVVRHTETLRQGHIN